MGGCKGVWGHCRGFVILRGRVGVVLRVGWWVGWLCV